VLAVNAAFGFPVDLAERGGVPATVKDKGFRQRSRQIAIPGTVLFGHDSSWTGEHGEWTASHAVGRRFWSGLSAPRRATGGPPQP
jgi:hypothetical protein